MTGVDLIRGHSFHGRKGDVRNDFRYSVDLVLLDPEATAPGPRLFARNRWAPFSIRDLDHGGPPGEGRGPAWAREVLAAHGLPAPNRVMLLAQPRQLGHVFNPISLWLAYCGDALNAVIAEVTNTFGDRHSYLCALPDGAPITATDRIAARKILHVSPFQPIEGGYSFRFDIRADRIGVWIDYTRPDGGLIATLVGPRKPLQNRDILYSLLRRPLGARRVLG